MERLKLGNACNITINLMPSTRYSVSEQWQGVRDVSTGAGHRLFRLLMGADAISPSSCSYLLRPESGDDLGTQGSSVYNPKQGIHSREKGESMVRQLL